MLKKFIEGLVFGCGFSISFVAIWYLATLLVWPAVVGSKMEELAAWEFSEQSPKDSRSSTSRTDIGSESGRHFHELELEEQIRRASIIALARYERDPDGKMKAIISEFLKKEPNVTVYYDIGDEYPSASYYPEENMNYGDGMVMFFTGSPATMRMSMTYFGDRIHSLGDLPIELLRRKCEEPTA